MKELKNNIFNVGVKNCDAYLIKGAKAAIIDGADVNFAGEYIKNIEEIMPVSEIDYIVCNHTGAERSGSIERVLELNPDIEVIGTIAAIKNLKEITNSAFNEHVAKDGAELDLGDGKILRFMITPNLPWPDTMMTYLKSEKILFSCNAFSTNRSVSEDDYEYNLKACFNSSISLFKPFVLKTTEKLSALDIGMICTGSGIIPEKYVREAIKKYAEWSRTVENEKKTAIIFYVSDSGYTAHMAKIIERTMLECGVDVKSFDITESYEVPELLNSADALVFGTPTINKNAAKPVWKIISELDLVNMKNTSCFVFGSYGWGGEGLYLVHNHLKLLRMKPFEKPFGCVFKPSSEDETELIKYTKRFVESL